MFLVSSCSCLCPIHWSQVLSWKWRCSWSGADRWCSNYIWVIKIWLPTKVCLTLDVWWYIVLWHSESQLDRVLSQYSILPFVSQTLHWISCLDPQPGGSICWSHPSETNNNYESNNTVFRLNEGHSTPNITMKLSITRTPAFWEYPPIASSLPILLSHIGSQVKRRQSQSYKFKELAKISNFSSLKQTLHATHLLKLLDKMCKYAMDSPSIVEDTERIRFCPQTDRVKPVYPLSTLLGGLYASYCFVVDQFYPYTSGILHCNPEEYG